jgi:hypothetical protein
VRRLEFTNLGTKSTLTDSHKEESLG